MPESQDKSRIGQPDPVFVHARREACVILAVWACCLIWTVGYYRLAGYDVRVESLNVVFGMPSWVFYGVFLPWMLATAFSVGFSLFVMRDDDLGEHEETDAESPERPVDRSDARDDGEAWKDAND